ncbi:MAG: hypothetical protein RQ826_03970 [Xanthomonadales bacterium]|nr:hypothetical protein [Xanthomonadales bacterium]
MSAYDQKLCLLLIRGHDLELRRDADSGNDLEVLTGEVPAVLVANSPPEVRELARRIAEQAGHGGALYIAHYHPNSITWMGFSNGGKAAEGI